MENILSNNQDIDIKLFENIEAKLLSLKNSHDSNTNINELIDQIIKINGILKEVLAFASISTKNHRDSANLFKEHQEILVILGEKVQDLYSLINGISNSNGNSLFKSDQDSANLEDVMEILDLHSTSLDAHDQHLKLHDNILDTLSQRIDLLNRR